jgi:hypothetical protein
MPFERNRNIPGPSLPATTVAPTSHHTQPGLVIIKGLRQ